MWLKNLYDTAIRWVWGFVYRIQRRIVLLPARFAMVALVAILAVQSATGAVIRVDASVQAPGGPGNTWANAYSTLQGALNHPDLTATDEIWVAASSTPYTPSSIFDPNDDPGDIPAFVSPCSCDADNRRMTFRLVKNVSLYGGFLGNAHPSGGETNVSEADPANNITTLSGDLGGGVHAFHVLTYFQEFTDMTPASVNMVVDGFVITEGVATGGDDDHPHDGALNAVGGGALVVYEEHELLTPPGPVFSRCEFKDNIAELGGGAIGGYYGGVRITDCRFENNSHNATSGTEFSGKTTRGGGAINAQGPIAILNSTFIANESVERGGACLHLASITSSGMFVVSNCKFYENTAPTGGAIDAGNAVTIIDCTFERENNDTGESNAADVRTSTVRK